MNSAKQFDRFFLRHPADIPIEIATEIPRQDALQRLKDVGMGGVACRSVGPLKVGSPVVLTIPLVKPPFSARGAVVWCRRDGAGGYEVGIRFRESDDVFAARMVEQICHIEHYRQEVLRAEGRVLDGESAALEWIALYAARFPSVERCNTH